MLVAAKLKPTSKASAPKGKSKSRFLDEEAGDDVDSNDDVSEDDDDDNANDSSNDFIDDNDDDDAGPPRKRHTASASYSDSDGEVASKKRKPSDSDDDDESDIDADLVIRGPARKAATTTTTTTTTAASSNGKASRVSVSAEAIDDISAMSGRKLSATETFRITFTDKPMLSRVLQAHRSVMENARFTIFVNEDGIGILQVDGMDSSNTTMGRSTLDCHIQAHDKAAKFEFFISLGNLSSWLSLQKNVAFVDVVQSKKCDNQIEFIAYDPQNDVFSDSTFTESCYEQQYESYVLARDLRVLCSHATVAGTCRSLTRTFRSRWRSWTFARSCSRA
jgi:hypothetical protein